MRLPKIGLLVLFSLFLLLFEPKLVLANTLNVSSNDCVGTLPSITLSWDSVPNAVSYELHRHDGATFFQSTAGSSAPATETLAPESIVIFRIPLFNLAGEANSSYTDTANQLNRIDTNSAYVYQLVAITKGDGREISNVVSLYTKTCRAPYPTLSFTTSCLSNSPVVDLYWTPVSGAYQYQLFRNDRPGTNPFVIDAATTDYHFRDYNNSLQEKTAYQYQIVAITNTQNLGSNTIFVLTLNCKPPGPVNFINNTPKAGCSGNNSIVDLIWSTPTNFYPTEGDYYVLQKVRKSDGREDSIDPVGRNNYQDSLLYPESYKYKIIAINSYSGSDSGWSSFVDSLNCSPPAIDLKINSSFYPRIEPGSTADIVWSVSNANICRASSNPVQGYWSGSVNSSGEIISPSLTRPPARITYTLTCTNTNSNNTQFRNVLLDIKAPVSCLKTTGGDVHSNQSIIAPSECP